MFAIWDYMLITLILDNGESMQCLIEERNVWYSCKYVFCGRCGG